MNDLPQLFRENIRNANLLQPDGLLLLALSGGIDSVVLCELCRLTGFQFAIAHCNFQLRGEESERDEYFVKSLSGHYQAEVFVKRFETEDYALENKISIQVAARILRYKWFDELAAALETERDKPVYILTAHHADDNIETVLMNFFKGTGIAGIRGMLPATGRLVRPLLFARKKVLIDFAREKGLSYVEDSSNASDKYSRNYVRHHILPVIEEKYPGAEDNILANLERFREVEMLYMQSIAVHRKKLMEQRGGEVYIAVQKLQKTTPLKTVVFEIIKEYGFTAKQAEEVIALLQSDSGRFVLSATHRMLRNRNWLIISPLPQNTSSVIVINEGEKERRFERGKLTLTLREIKKGSEEIPEIQSVAYLDSMEIRFPLLLRKWKPGDYFYPLGMRKKKKLSRFFIDRKLSLSEKENTWVIEMDKKILWVVNHRIDDRFKITSGTQQILQLEISIYR
ncbi:tRNA lysidine(34) synthetase TilS [Agriterribacter sp.]|uniref:tRNA lysidine(34) synthetase TilS n=1 Tax=Agriterribacter sp. TaxID=2821509 RepID=UPI002B7E2F91|nr:tRNA lysidine(34) synthetase TilS [Agriterribacter sp.]HRO47717.1 tRNA lysidine(34) synthetase TilS [Agriterribacter sp.]HRQ19426.1 tRNA lysidine(34) synthetase TilS [Agriterribacter sp.]